ncbi:sigma-54-dependent Fis family transcriptional regulator [Jannaschia pagri]|uniref:Sigma-54-dependent Fis family transcriptional regulator n=1 Tax=Jannaschia pagri TaxID=2829797 RepID=A0ABQ4NR21_9RHOB|nr:MULTISPECIES: sigma-54 dependent transcriptional regulator [unclassified Jannaschia]GIT93024.1 sigma-54-dependent Fis family transcriptional regulator [Jannaschia sp. AI_61]GIT96859.1 sigma-54-dependent Fis family transcriptional regulator [Jannaschia sp. AI_62]
MATTLPTVLVVDDEPHSVAAMRMALEDDFQVLEAGNAEQAWALMEEHWVQVVLSDQRMPGKTGIELLTEMRDRWPETVRIIVTGYTESNDMIQAINEAGIYQFITKPWHPDQLLMAVRNAARLFQLARDHERMSLEMRYLGSTADAKLEQQRRALQEGLGFDKVLRGPNSSLNATIALARHYASFDVPVLIAGEPGTGKTDLARAMHYGSLRADRPFYELNCAGLTDDVLRLELFGAKRGALRDGAPARTGLLQRADRGTVFLNGIDSLSPGMQIALLRVATEGAFDPIGGHETLTSRARLIAGAHGDLRAAVADGRFRTDLFYALAVTELAVPPLRGRPGDIALLADRLLAEAADAHGKPARGFSNAALDFLEGYDWPGNIPELRNEVTRMLVLAQEMTLGPELISRHILQAEPGETGADREAAQVGTLDGTLKDRVEMMEARILRETLTRCKWNKSRAATELGLSRVGLRAKLDRYGIEPHAVSSEED